MRTVTFKSVLNRALRRMGRNPDNETRDSIIGVAEAISEAVREAWRTYWWPELMRVDQRQFAADYSAATTYAEGDRVYDATTDAYYESAQAANNGNAVTDTTYWTVLENWEMTLELEATGATEIGDVRGVWSKNPLVFRDAAMLTFRITAGGLTVVDGGVTRPWVQFRLPPNEFTGVTFDAGNSYVEGDLVYYATTGECYKAKAGAGSALPTSTVYWTKVDMPQVLATYASARGMVHLLREDGQFVTANIESARAERVLDGEISTYARDQRQVNAQTATTGAIY